MVTDPSWTPLFVGCAAVILQVGGALQHGALCAREYGKPGVSCIDIASLELGMKVSVDGNTGVVTILDETFLGGGGGRVGAQRKAGSVSRYGADGLYWGFYRPRELNWRLGHRGVEVHRQVGAAETCHHSYPLASSFVW